MNPTFVLNFGHRLAKDVLAQLEPVVEIYCPLHLDLNGNLDTRTQVINKVEIARQALQEAGGNLEGSDSIVVALPGITEGAVLLVAEIAGRSGSLPRVVLLRRRPDGTFGLYGGIPDTGVLDLDRVLRAARGRRR